MDCPSCRTLLPADARFCVGCGAPAPVTCGACSCVNPPGANFCLRCGTRLHAPAPAPFPSAAPAPLPPAAAAPRPALGDAVTAERRQLTVLFCDLVGSTALSSRLDPEDLREVIGSYHRCVADTVARFDGFVARYMGDGALVYFGYPQAHEDNAERAVRAALALVAAIGQLRPMGETLTSRIGIATGLVVVGELVNAGAAREQTALGETPNLAARLQGVAGPDEVVIADATRRLVAGVFEFRDLGAIALKGFAEPQRASAVTGRRRAERLGGHTAAEPALPYVAAAQAGDTALVGRAAELAALAAAWRETVAGRGRVVLVAGDAGVGKSRLARSFVHSIAGTPHALVEFRCAPHAQNSPLYPVLYLMPTALGWARGDDNDAKLAKLAAFCSASGLSAHEGLPLLIAVLGLPPSPAHPLPPMGPERQKQRTLETLSGVIGVLAAQAPLLMVVEDLHWVDPTTLELVELLVTRVADLRAMLLFTARPHFQPDWPASAEVMPVTLGRFTRDESERLVEQVAGGRVLPRAVVDEIVAKTDGVPLFVEELTKMVVESGLLARDGDRFRLDGPLPPLAIPATLQDSLTARLDRLATVKVVAQLAATLGREFSWAWLRAVAGLDDRTLARELERLVDAELLHQQGQPPEAVYTFKHALIQEAAYQSLLRSTRQQFHERIARALVDGFPDEVAARPEFVAMHFTEGGNVEAALSWWRRAGRRAFERAAFAEAAAHYRRGLAALAAAPHTPARDSAELGLQVELGYALIPVAGWAAASTAEAFGRAGALCRDVGDAPTAFRALWGLGAFHFVRGDQRQARRLADQCLAIARTTQDTDALIQAEYLVGAVLCACGEFAAASACLASCVERYGPAVREGLRAQYGQDTKAAGLGWLAMALWVRGEPDVALARAEEGLAFVREARAPFLVARGHAGVGFLHLFRGEPQGPGGALGTARAICAEQGFAYFHAMTTAFEGANRALAGDPAGGAELMEDGLAALRAIGSELLFTVLAGYLAAALLSLGRHDAGLAAIDDGLDCVARNGEHWGEAELYRLRGELLLAQSPDNAARAAAAFERALAIARRQGAVVLALRAATSLARLERAQGRADSARALLGHALAHDRVDGDTPELRAARALADALR